MASPDDPVIKISLRLSQWRAVVKRLDLIGAGVIVIPLDGVAMVDPEPYDFRTADRIIRRAVERRQELDDR